MNQQQRDYAKAVKLAIEALEIAIKPLAIDANIYKQFGTKNPTQMNAYERTQEFKEAIEVLRHPPML